MRTPKSPEPGAPDPLPDRVKWQYHYTQTFWGGATHYIVLDEANDAPDLTALGAFGYVCANVTQLSTSPPP